MSIRQAILGFLSWQPLAGYDLKRMIENSVAYYWSGNNNQIYTVLSDLEAKGLATATVVPQEKRPARKVYTITESGREELRNWVVSSPELPQLKHSFLIQLAWSDLLSHEELLELCDRYEEEVRQQLERLDSEQQRQIVAMGRTERESYLWVMVLENGIRYYTMELDWIRDFKGGLPTTSA